MKKLILLSLVCSHCLQGLCRQEMAPKSRSAVGSADFTLGEKEFLLNGKPFLIRAGEVHFPRIPRQYWDHRIKMLKAMGMNTVCIYLFWNLHEQEEGKFDFSGQRDVAAFVRLIQQNGMYCIVRPGPYACAEWDMGGLPWWLLKKKDLKVRSLQDTLFMQRSARYLMKVGQQLAPLQIQNGGPVIMVQVENEYGAFGSDAAYMEATRVNLRKAGFDKVQLMRCDWSSTFDKYETSPEVAVTLNFGAGSDVEKEFSKFKKMHPSAPLMCSEYWTGWFDNWGRPHETRSVESFIGSLKDMLDRRISFSLYMAHGGTTFGQWGGANSPPYSPMVTSYDYNAPIDEQGSPTDKFYAVRALMQNYLNPGEKIPAVPEPKPVITIPEFSFRQTSSLFDQLPPAHISDKIRTMEDLGQGWGRVMYRTRIDGSGVDRKLVVHDVHDWAAIFLNGRLIGKLDRRRNDHTITVPATPQVATLDILVEATGRVNFGEAIIDRKGITDSVMLEAGHEQQLLSRWQIYSFPVDYSFQADRKFVKRPASGPAWYKGSFRLSDTGDTFLDLSSWGKGMIWVNGYNIGRFWKIGPQQTVFVPGPWLKKGINEVLILDLEVPQKASIRGLAKPIIDKIVPDVSLLARKPGQLLELNGEQPISEGRFTEDKVWQEVLFKNEVKGRYFCFEALNSLLENDVTSSIAELQILGPGGKPVSTRKWKLIYADSEEVTSGNHAADRVYDLQESTYWQTESVSHKVTHPHQLVIDMGDLVPVTGMRYLPRTDKKKEGMIGNYRIYVKQEPFKF